jgi:hypothetical protein
MLESHARLKYLSELIDMIMDAQETEDFSEDLKGATKVGDLLHFYAVLSHNYNRVCFLYLYQLL